MELGDFVPSTENFEVDHMMYKTGRGRGKASPVERKTIPQGTLGLDL
jgi:hypothetical protein